MARADNEAGQPGRPTTTGGAAAPGWPIGGGAMGAAIRAHDWSRSPLGPPGGWSPALRATVAMILPAEAEIVLFWGADYCALYNDSYTPTIGDKHPHALGRPAREYWSELWDDLRPLLDSVRETGQTVSAKDRPFSIARHGYLEQVYFDISYSPIHNDAGAIEGIICIVAETTARVRAQAALRESEARQAFLLTFADTLRPLTDPEAVQRAAATALGQRLGASRVGFAEPLDDETVVVTCTYTDGVPAIAGRFRSDEYSPTLLPTLRAGQSLVRADVANDADLTAAERATHAAQQIGASIDQPVLRDGRLQAILFIHQRAARDWTADELALAEEAAGRIWEATERARAEAALRQREERYRTLFSAIDEGFCIAEVLFDEAGVGRDYRFEELNEAFEQMSGLAATPGKTALELVPELEPHWARRYGEVARTGVPARFSAGSAALGRAFDVYAARVGAAGSNQVAIVFNDVTAQRNAEAERERLLAAAETERARLAELFTQAPAAICLLAGPDHVFTLANKHYRDLVGGRDVVGKPIREALPELAGQGLYELLDGVYQTGVPFVGDAVQVFLDQDGDGEVEEVFFNFVYAPYREADGGPGGIFVHAYEVTTQVRARLAAEEAVRARDTFLSIAAHELRTPLTALKGTAQLLRRRVERGILDPARLATSVQTLDQSASRLITLTDDLLDVARIRTGQLPLTLHPVDLAALAAEAVAQARDLAGETHHLTLDRPVTPPTVLADAGRIEQILTNLLDNALKYSPQGGDVALTVRAEGAGVALAVRDAGIGLPPGAAETIFAPFGRAANAAASSLPGMGLGLFICRSIVERHGGWIRATSDGEGHGTTVTFWLPAGGPGE